MKYVTTVVLLVSAAHAHGKAITTIEGNRSYSAKIGSAAILKQHMDTLPPMRRRVLWFTPVRRSTIIDGVAIGVWAAPRKKSLVVNGLNVEANPAALILWAYEFIGDIVGPFEAAKTEELAVLTLRKYPDNDTSVHAAIRGISISAAQVGGKIDGLGMNLISSWATEMHGLELSGLMNLHYNCDGVVLSARNKTTRCKGVQIGIFNECKEGTLLQVGLMNRIGNRVTPFVNFSLKRKNKEHHGRDKKRKHGK